MASKFLHFNVENNKRHVESRSRLSQTRLVSQNRGPHRLCQEMTCQKGCRTTRRSQQKRGVRHSQTSLDSRVRRQSAVVIEMTNQATLGEDIPDLETKLN